MCPGDNWQCLETFFAVTTRGKVRLASCGKGPGTLPSIFQRTRQPRPHRTMIQPSPCRGGGTLVWAGGAGQLQWRSLAFTLPHAFCCSAWEDLVSQQDCELRCPAYASSTSRGSLLGSGRTVMGGGVGPPQGQQPHCSLLGWHGWWLPQALGERARGSRGVSCTVTPFSRRTPAALHYPSPLRGVST